MTINSILQQLMDICCFVFPQRETNNNLGIPLSANNNEGTQPQPGDNPGLTDGVIN